MKSRWTRLVVALSVAWVFCAGHVVAMRAQEAPAGKSSSLHLYTEAQARRGEAVVLRDCESCHSDNLKDGEGDVSLSGERFLSKWGLVSLGDMANIIRTTMPVQAPNSLTVQEATDVVAYVLWLNFYPAGPTELPADLSVLKGITLQTPEEHFRLFTK